ncbi:hypothetical protein FQN54_005107 [Arachnomyces sp. PD_36]|nr:hypothetical protein FQN54_005107 [Arachnomyces sp. PD_36]
MGAPAMEGSSENIRQSGGDEKCAQLDSILHKDLEIVPENTLRAISQGSMKNYISGTEDYISLGRLWGALLNTFKAANISSSHRVAACNGVCAFLEAAWASQNTSIRKFPLSEDVWFSTMRVYWARFEEGKSKPMLQVLATLTKILKSHPERGVAESISQGVVDEVVSGLTLGENRSKSRAFISSLEVLIRKQAIPITHFLFAIQSWLVKNYERWILALKHDCSELSIPAATFSNSNAKDDSASTDVHVHAVQIFTIALLRHSVNPDLTPSVGLLLSTLSRFVKKFVGSPEKGPVGSSRGLSTFWASPLKYTILNNLASVETMSKHILYPLFSTDHSTFNRFIEKLPIQAFLASGMMPDVSSEEFTLLFSTLQVAKQIGLVHEDRLLGKSNQNAQEKVILDSRRVGKFIAHQDSSIRISALSLLVTAQSTTNPLTPGTFQALRENLPFIHADPDPHTRGEIINLIRALIIRLRGGMALSQRVMTNGHSSTKALPGVKDAPISIDDLTSVEDQYAFLQWYVDFLQSELRPTASYQRHISALKVLDLVLSSGIDKRIDKSKLSKLGQDQSSWVRPLDVFKPTFFKILVDLLVDPFDDVRSTSLAILGFFPADIISATQTLGSTSSESLSSQLFQALSRAEQLASRTSRADHADTVARLFLALFTLADNKSTLWYRNKSNIVDTILTSLEKKLSCPAGLFSTTMRDHPLHGYISALRNIVGVPNFYSLVSDPEDTTFRKWELFHGRSLSLCGRIWVEIKDVLCVDSPEGHTDSASDDLIIGPKDILSYSWRALRESRYVIDLPHPLDVDAYQRSLLLHSILSNPTYAPTRGLERLTYEDYDKIGSLSFMQLTELRHRGAFSAVSQTFAICCQCCGRSKEASVSSLLDTWYQTALKIIDDQASQLTRRSAGLPALVSAIVSSDPGGALFEKIIRELHEISSQQVVAVGSEKILRLPQVHAMNCLKDIFTTSRLRQSTEPFVMPALVISADWEIRNCGLMLFRALMLRMSRATPGSQGFGDVLDSEAGLRIQFRKYPGLMHVLERLLQPDGRSNDSVEVSDQNSTTSVPKTEQVFPALELISEKVPSVEEDHILRGLALHHTQSPIWAIREQAARTFAFLLNNNDDIVPTIRKLLSKHHLGKDQNHLHGTLLCIRYSIRRFRFVAQGSTYDCFHRTAALCEEIFRYTFSETRSPFVKAALVDILNDTIEDGIACDHNDHVASFVDSLAWEYGLYDVLENTLTSNNAIDPTRTIHSSTLLRKALGLTTLLSLLLGRSDLEASCALLDNISTVDPDASQWILEQCHRCLRDNKPLWSQMIQLYVNILTNPYAESVMTMATSNLADLLESFLDDGPCAAPELDIATMRTELAAIPSEVSQTSIWGRDIVDADLRLHGCILAIQSTSDQFLGSPQRKASLEMWCHKLRFALREETEFTTRYSAVVSMKTFIQASLASRPSADVEPFPLDVYLILYDMLNDDDEELRDISTISCSYILKTLQNSRESDSSALVPLAASSQLARFLAKNYQESPQILHETIRRLTGQDVKLPANSLGTSMLAVSSFLDEYMQSSTVLFEEEKQNLFIDDAWEADVWSDVLGRLSIPSKRIHPTLSKKFPQWVSDGLLSLTEAAQLEGAGGLLGFTSKPEIFVIGLRVIQAARLLLSKDLAVGFDFDKRLLTTRAIQLLYVGREAWVHSRWLSNLESALHGINLDDSGASPPITKLCSTSEPIRDRTKMKERDTIIVILVVVLAIIIIVWRLGASYVFYVAQEIADIRARAEAMDESDDERRLRTEIETRLAIEEEEARRADWPV